MTPSPRPSLLIVDDTPDKLVAVGAILLDLDVEIVKVRSGREALRRLLTQDFAVVLLDVRMPGMDGFETAALMRQRPRSEHTPIIFITAFPDETHAARGYSLRAVDYIMTPIVPDVLRTKVSVFVELFRATAEVRRQADCLRERAEQLRRLAASSLAINSAPSIDAMLGIVTASARDILGTRGALAVARLDDGHPRRVLSSPEVADEADEALSALVCTTNRPASSRRDPDEGAPAEGPRPKHRPDRSLAVPFVTRDGGNLGALQIFGRAGADFTEEDQALLVQLAQMTAIAMENTLFAEAREANRLKDEFLATVSHELRTPLSAIRTWSWMLRRGDLKPPEVTKALEAIDRNITAQTRIVDDLLEVSRIVTGKLRLRARPLELVALVDTAVEALLPDANAKGIALLRDLAPVPAPVLGDPERLQQVVWNLVSNAIKFTPRGGRIDVRVARANGEVRLTVSDTGKGISPAFLPHVFERFRQADGTSTRSVGGLGLGLAIVRHLVELHGGRVEASSDGVDQGATFTVSLPLTQTAELAEPRRAREREEAPRLDGVRVLVVEDDVDTRESIELVLAEAGARVTAVDCAAEAWVTLTASRPDVMVCDLGLPGEDGYSLMSRVRALDDVSGRVLPALALTAYAQSSDRERALAAGFLSHLAKPVSPVELLQEIARAMPVRGGAPATSHDAPAVRPPA